MFIAAPNDVASPSRRRLLGAATATAAGNALLGHFAAREQPQRFIAELSAVFHPRRTRR